jgi:chondroitin AC lyase
MIKYLFILLYTVFGFTNVFADDFDVIYDRFYSESYADATPSKGTTDNIVALLASNGAFSDINYSTTDDILQHLDYMNTLALAYAKSNSAYYHNTTIRSKYITALDYWVTLNHNPANWWFKEIGYPNTLSSGLVLMINEVQSINLSLFNRSVTYLKAGYAINKNMEGANGADKIMGAFLASVITKNTVDMTTYLTHIGKLLVVQNTGEGIEVDWMWGAHSYFGRQLNANYLVEFLNSHLRFLSFTKGTTYYRENNTAFLEDIFIQGLQ